MGVSLHLVIFVNHYSDYLRTQNPRYTYHDSAPRDGTMDARSNFEIHQGIHNSHCVDNKRDGLI